MAHDFRIGRVAISKRLGYRPDELSDVNFDGGQQANDHTSEYRRQHDIAPRILGFFRQCGNPVKPNVGQHRDGCAPKEAAEGKGLRVVERPGKERGIRMRMAEDVACGNDEYHHDDGTHACGHAGVNAC